MTVFIYYICNVCEENIPEEDWEAHKKICHALESADRPIPRGTYT